ncbi:MAG: hypothetical protein LAO03_16345 [Acidobacteriia bacterium]|nr:hypothetical protein [Terriglobia bacterium]
MRSQHNNSATRNRRTHIPLPGQVPEIDAVGLVTRKSRGEAAEAAFLAKAASLGFGIAKPWGDSERYDFILDSGRQFWRVQVKSTECHADSRYCVKAAGCNTRYTADEIDFLVAFIVPENLWYIIPVSEAAAHHVLRFYPANGQRSLMEKYREAWCQMACRRKSKGPNLIKVEPGCQQGRPCPRK